MHLETSRKELSLLVKKYAHDLQNTRKKYNLDTNNMNFDFTKITNKNVRARMEEKQSGNKDEN